MAWLFTCPATCLDYFSSLDILQRSLYNKGGTLHTACIENEQVKVNEFFYQNRNKLETGQFGILMHFSGNL